MRNKLRDIFSDYTNLILLLLFITTFSGALRKWGGLPNMANNILLLIIMLIPSYLFLFFKNQQTIPLKKGIKNIIYIFLYVLVVLAINPLNTSIFHGIFGILIHLMFIAIIAGYLKNKNTFDEKRIIKPFFIILAIQLVLGTIQYNSSSDSYINRYADNSQEQTDEDIYDPDDTEQAIATVGSAVRVTGTFSYLGGYTALLIFFWLFTFYMAKAKGAKYLFILSPIILYASLMSGARASVGFSLILLASFMLIERKLIIKKSKPIFISLVAVITLVGGYIILGDRLGIVGQAESTYENFMSRFEGGKAESEGRLTRDFISVFNRDFEYKYTGVGLGSTYQGANALFGTSEIVKSTPMEGELFRIVVEGGLFFILIRWLILIALLSSLELPKLLKICFFIIFGIFSPTVFHIYNAVYISIGIICLNQVYSKLYHHAKTIS